MESDFYDAMFEYSVLVSFSVVTVCSVITVIMASIWFGFDIFNIPVILNGNNQPIIQTPEKQMVQVTNPFALELGSGPTSVTDGMLVKLFCLEPCVLTCFWGCEVCALQGALQTEQHDLRLSSPQHFLDALQLRYRYCESFHVGSRDGKEFRTRIPADHGITDFGLLPRDRYPLVTVLTLAEPEARNSYNIVANVTVIHVPDEKYSLSARILFQYLLTSQRHKYELKPLFMSAVSGDASDPADPEPRTEDGSRTEEDLDPEDRDQSQGSSADCVVCQNAAITRVLLPCRHTCVCDSCVEHVQHCPICRAFVLESFVLELAAQQ